MLSRAIPVLFSLVLVFACLTASAGPYGDIADAVIDSEEWDETDGLVENPEAFVRLGDSSYFMTCGRGASADGYLTVIEVSDAGIFTNGPVSEWEYDDTDGRYAGILHIADDLYAVYYMDASDGVLFTTRAWASNGTLQKTVLDSETYTKPYGQHLIHVTGDIYALTYQEYSGGYDHFLETYEITSAGAISARLDVVEYDEASTARGDHTAPRMALVDDDTVLLAFANSGSKGNFYTYNISNTGDITNTYADYWEYDSTRGTYPHIKKLAGNTFIIAYACSGNDGALKTFTVSDEGAFTEAWIDELEYDEDNGIFPVIFTIADANEHDPGVYGVTYQGTDADGFVFTVNISSAGDIGAGIDLLEFDTSDSSDYAPCIHIADNVYAICYSGTGSDGWAVSVNITTPSGELPDVNDPPSFSSLDPFDGETDVALGVGGIHLTITDAEGDMFNYSWACSDGSSNSASGNTNGSKYLMFNFGDLDCGTTYTWWINASEYNNDSNYNNGTFTFTTRDCAGVYANVHPSNNSASVCPCHQCHDHACVCINGTHEGGNNVNISFYSNYTGPWLLLGMFSNVSGSYCAFFPADYETRYWWYSNISEYQNGTNYNQTPVFTFTTGSYLDCTNCSGAPGECNSTNLSLYEDLLNATGWHNASYDPGTGWSVWANYTGNGSGPCDETSLSEEEMSFALRFALFALFMGAGYLTRKKSGGALMLIAGFALLSFIGTFLLVVPVSLFIMMLGIAKWLFDREAPHPP